MQHQINFQIPIPKHFNQLLKFQQTPNKAKRSQNSNQHNKNSHERNNSIYTSPQFFKNILERKFYEDQKPIQTKKSSILEQHKLAYPTKEQSYILKENLHQKKSQLFQSPNSKNIKSPYSFNIPNKTDENKVILSKFKLFFKSIMQHQNNQQQISMIWQQFQKSVQNPFDFDQFIEKTNQNSKRKIQIKSMTNISIDSNITKKQKTKQRKESLQLTQKKGKNRIASEKIRAKSQQKYKLKQNWKESIQKQVKKITSSFRYGKQVIKDKYMTVNEFGNKY